MQRSYGESGRKPDPTLLGGRYALGPMLGEGAFSITYRAVDTILGRPVALKIARAQYASDRDFVIRFEREARLAASVSHPNIVDVYDYGPHEETYFIAMQFVAGSDLGRIISEKTRLASIEASHIVRQVLAGLEAIHSVGIIHRDIKPHNVLVGDDGVARVTDFGIAYTALEDGLTSHGTTIGTASYMAPEQAQGGTLSVRTDLYAVGVMLFQCVTGRLPFEAENPMAVMLAHLQRPAPLPSVLAPDAEISAPLEDVIMRAMAKDPSDRFASAGEMSATLASATGGGTRAADTTTQSIAAVQATDVAATMPAAELTLPEQRRWAVPPPAPQRSGLPWNRIGAVLFVLLALFAGGAALAGTIGDRSGGTSERDLPGITGGGTPTTTVTPPLATAPSLAIDGRVSTETATATFVVTSTTTPEPAATGTPTRAATTTPSPEPTVTATATFVPTVTESPVPPATSTATLAPVATETAEPTETPVPVDVDSGTNDGAPTIAPAARDRQTVANNGGVSFGPSDWSGACTNVDTATYGREAVAIRGSGSSCSKATLSFQLDEAPSGETALVLNGFNGESQAMMLAIEINGSRSSASNQFFDVWDGSRASVESTWSQARVVLPPGYLRAGQNTISLVSTTPGSSPTGPPYVLLGGADLEL